MKGGERQDYSKFQILIEDKLHKIGAEIKYFSQRHIRILAQTAEIVQSVIILTLFS
jgi:hypothetical protein